MQTGVLEEMIDLTKRYVAEREQFGARIGSFQSVSHRMADAWIDLMTLRLLAQSAAAMLDAAPLATLEVLSAQSTENPDETDLEQAIAAMAHATEVRVKT